MKPPPLPPPPTPPQPADPDDDDVIVLLPDEPSAPSNRHRGWVWERATGGRDRQELAFLPAALEVLETPASPLGRIVTWMLVLIVATALAWSWFGKVDAVAVAQGRVVPGGNVKNVAHSEGGVVVALAVREGQAVTAGQALLTIDPVAAVADQEQVEADLVAAEATIAAVRTTLDRQQAGQPPAGLVFAGPAINSHVVAEHRQLVRELEGLDAEIGRLDASANAARVELEAARSLLPLQREQEESLRALLAGARPDLPRARWLERLQTLRETEAALARAEARTGEVAAERGVLAARRAQAVIAFQVKLLDRLREAEAKRDQATAMRRRTSHRADLAVVRAPVAGIVHRLAVAGLGAVIKPGDTILVLVPSDAVLEIEAFAKNLDIAHLKTGQTAQLKIEAFPFTEHGIIDAEVTLVGADAINDERRGMIFPITLRPLANGRGAALRPRLVPGMSVECEVLTERRRVIEYLLSPIQRHHHDALRER